LACLEDDGDGDGDGDSDWDRDGISVLVGATLSNTVVGAAEGLLGAGGAKDGIEDACQSKEITGVTADLGLPSTASWSGGWWWG